MCDVYAFYMLFMLFLKDSEHRAKLLRDCYLPKRLKCIKWIKLDEP